MPHIFSFFSGAGFLDLGFETTGFSIDFVNEFHRPFLDAYIFARQNLNIPEPFYGYSDSSVEDFLAGNAHDDLIYKINNVRANGHLVGFIAGPPCPDFSIGGKNRGHTGDHGRLSGAYFELIVQQNPDFFLFENVKGLWRTKKHRVFYEELKQQARNAGYILTEKLLNSIEYGVPQDRERIILLGFHRQLLIDLGIQLEDGTNMLDDTIFHWDLHKIHNAEHVLNLNWPTTSPYLPDTEVLPPENIIQELTIEHWFLKNNIANHLNANHHFKPRAGLRKFESIDEGDVSKKSFKRLHRWRYSPTAAYGNNEVHLHPYKPRRLSVAEALAIQSMPANFILPPDMTLSNMFKTIGNGVPFLLANALAQTILDFLGE